MSQVFNGSQVFKCIQVFNAPQIFKLLPMSLDVKNNCSCYYFYARSK